MAEVVVTARRREETLISAPVAASVVSASELQRRGINTIDNLMSAVPQLAEAAAGAEVAAALAGEAAARQPAGVAVQPGVAAAVRVWVVAARHPAHRAGAARACAAGPEYRAGHPPGPAPKRYLAWRTRPCRAVQG